jgi:hypothetical protein
MQSCDTGHLHVACITEYNILEAHLLSQDFIHLFSFFFAVLGIELRASNLLGKRSTT